MKGITMKKNLAIAALIYALANAGIVLIDRAEVIADLQNRIKFIVRDYNKVLQLATYYQKLINENGIRLDEFDEIALQEIISK